MVYDYHGKRNIPPEKNPDEKLKTAPKFGYLNVHLMATGT